jgi:hypothetical protein
MVVAYRLALALGFLAIFDAAAAIRPLAGFQAALLRFLAA